MNRKHLLSRVHDPMNAAPTCAVERVRGPRQLPLPTALPQSMLLPTLPHGSATELNRHLVSISRVQVAGRMLPPNTSRLAATCRQVRTRRWSVRRTSGRTRVGSSS